MGKQDKKSTANLDLAKLVDTTENLEEFISLWMTLGSTLADDSDQKAIQCQKDQLATERWQANQKLTEFREKNAQNMSDEVQSFCFNLEAKIKPTKGLEQIQQWELLLTQTTGESQAFNQELLRLLRNYNLLRLIQKEQTQYIRELDVLVKHLETQIKAETKRQNELGHFIEEEPTKNKSKQKKLPGLVRDLISKLHTSIYGQSPDPKQPVNVTEELKDLLPEIVAPLQNSPEDLKRLIQLKEEKENHLARLKAASKESSRQFLENARTRLKLDGSMYTLLLETARSRRGIAKQIFDYYGTERWLLDQDSKQLEKWTKEGLKSAKLPEPPETDSKKEIAMAFQLAIQQHQHLILEAPGRSIGIIYSVLKSIVDDDQYLESVINDLNKLLRIDANKPYKNWKRYQHSPGIQELSIHPLIEGGNSESMPRLYFQEFEIPPEMQVEANTDKPRSLWSLIVYGRKRTQGDQIRRIPLPPGTWLTAKIGEADTNTPTQAPPPPQKRPRGRSGR